VLGRPRAASAARGRRRVGDRTCTTVIVCARARRRPEGLRLSDGRLPEAGDIFAALPPPHADGAALRAAIRGLRAADGVLTGVVDDDPTGSQAMHDVQVVLTASQSACDAALAGPAGTCFVLTNSRSMDSSSAAAATAQAARALIAAARSRGRRIQLVSRSDSTLRGHVMAEIAALQSVRAEVSGTGFDGVLLVPAFLEAGRLTAADIHWARSPAGLVPVGTTEFARDAAFGYTSSDLKNFLAEKTGGQIAPPDVLSVSITDIRAGGPARVRELLAGLRAGMWAVVNATEYSDLETVACGVLQAERAGQRLAFRTGPSFVRALTGTEPAEPLRGERLWAGGRRAGHGLIVVGSHVGQTSRQLAVLLDRSDITGIELSVPAVVGGSQDAVAATARQVSGALRGSHVVLYTSRTVAAADDVTDGLRIARMVSAAVARTVRLALPAGPAWILAKGGITSHDVAVHGLGMLRAEVAGQLLPGVISVFRPVDAAPEAVGLPYVVFAGNVGDDQTLAQVVGILDGSRDTLSRR
jgi:uncharacterized protein YgbK (DUF1537 family)